MTLSELIINYRTKHGISQRQMAALCSVSTGYISLIEKETNPQTGKRMIPTLTVLNKLAKGMGMTIDDLLAACDDMPVDISEQNNPVSTEPRIFISSSSFSLTPDEENLIRKFRCLDSRGKAAIRNALEFEYNSLPSSGVNTSTKEA